MKCKFDKLHHNRNIFIYLPIYLFYDVMHDGLFIVYIV